MTFRSYGKTLKSAIVENFTIVLSMGEICTAQKIFFKRKHNLVGGVSNPSKAAAIAVRSYLLKGFTGGNDPVMLLMGLLKNLNSDRLKSAIIDSLKLENESFSIVSATATNNGISNAVFINFTGTNRYPRQVQLLLVRIIF